MRFQRSLIIVQRLCFQENVIILFYLELKTPSFLPLSLTEIANMNGEIFICSVENTSLEAGVKL